MAIQSLLPDTVGLQVDNDPFPHLICRVAMPKPLYCELAAGFPTMSAILRGRDAAVNNAAARLPCVRVLRDPEIPPLWLAFFAYHSSAAFWRDILRLFAPVFRAQFPAAEAHLGKSFVDWRVAPRGLDPDADAWLDCQFVVNTPVRTVSSVKTVHVDKTNTMFSGLFYFREDGDTSSGGDLQLYRWRRSPRFVKRRMILPKDVELARTVPYDANAFIGFVNDGYAAHAVSSRSLTDRPRRYVNLIVESKFDVFALPQVSPWVQILHFPQLRRIGYRALGGDRRE